MALDQHGALLKMGVIVSQHHLTGRLCWSWLSWFICLSTRKWARALCQQVEDAPLVFSVMRGLWNVYMVRAEHQTAQELAEYLLTLAQRHQSSALLLEAHAALGVSSMWQGALAAAHAHLEQARALYDPQQHRAHALLYGLDPGMISRCYAAFALWVLGYPEQARQRLEEGMAQLQQGLAAWRTMGAQLNQ